MTESESQLSILLVDDSAAARRHVLDALEGAIPAQFTQASDGAAGLKHAQAHSYDLVITDLNMPELDGVAMATELRKMRGYVNVPILILTSDPTRERLRDGRAVGITGWLIKPPKPEVLLTTVKHALGLRVR